MKECLFIINVPPKEVSTAILAPLTCRSPAFPISCLTASTRRATPPPAAVCPWPSIPPLVLIGNLPPGQVFPSYTKAPASPRLHTAKALQGN